VQVVEVRDPAAIGGFEEQFAAGQVQAQPGVTTRAWQGDIELAIAPLRITAGKVDVQLGLQPGAQVTRQALTGLIGQQPLLQGRWQHRLPFDDLRAGFDLRCVVQRDSGYREQQHAHQAERRADPVPLAQGAEPEMHGGPCYTKKCRILGGFRV